MELQVTSKTRIRNLNINDAPRIFEMGQGPQLSKWLPDQVYANLDEAISVLNYLISQYKKNLNPKSNPLVLGVEFQNYLVGHVGLSPLGDTVEIGYAVCDKYSNQGIATDAVQAFAKWALQHLPLNEIVGIVANENIGSYKVLEKAGFLLVEEGEMNYLGKKRLCRKYMYKKN